MLLYSVHFLFVCLFVCLSFRHRRETYVIISIISIISIILYRFWVVLATQASAYRYKLVVYFMHHMYHDMCFIFFIFQLNLKVFVQSWLAYLLSFNVSINVNTNTENAYQSDTGSDKHWIKSFTANNTSSVSPLPLNWIKQLKILFQVCKVLCQKFTKYKNKIL